MQVNQTITQRPAEHVTFGDITLNMSMVAVIRRHKKGIYTVTVVYGGEFSVVELLEPESIEAMDAYLKRPGRPWQWNGGHGVGGG